MINGMIACVNYRILLGRIGTIVCSHLNGKMRHKRASLTNPNTVLLCEISSIFFYSSIASNRLIILSTCRNLNRQ